MCNHGVRIALWDEHACSIFSWSRLELEKKEVFVSNPAQVLEHIGLLQILGVRSESVKTVVVITYIDLRDFRICLTYSISGKMIAIVGEVEIFYQLVHLFSPFGILPVVLAFHFLPVPENLKLPHVVAVDLITTAKHHMIGFLRVSAEHIVPERTLASHLFAGFLRNVAREAVTRGERAVPVRITCRGQVEVISRFDFGKAIGKVLGHVLQGEAEGITDEVVRQSRENLGCFDRGAS
mmetsp:Transcript_37481/g.76446  ORF Transcript_37481/g.76446 Transcript_37481/m.76446 type:complete len:237 (+) Transcript_37481:135-845(+)